MNPDIIVSNVKLFLVALGSYKVTDELWLSCPDPKFGELLQCVEIQDARQDAGKIKIFIYKRE